MAFEYLDKIEELTEANLTVREQSRLAENPLDLRYPAIFPVERVDTLKISGARVLDDDRPAGGRRDWNGQARELTERVGPTIEAEIAPINTSHHIDERRLTELRAASQGVRALIDRGVIRDVNTWPPKLVDAVERNLEAEAFEGWQTGTINALDTKTNATIAIALPIDAGRFVNEATVWSDASVDAFDLLIARLETAIDTIGAVGAVRLRRRDLKTILADAPAQESGARATLESLTERVNEELGSDGTIQFVIDERWYHAFSTGSAHARTKTYYVTLGNLLFQPADGRVGTTYKAPVARAYDFLPQHIIDRGGAQDVVTFRTPKNDGKTLMLEAQENAAALPDEDRVFVVRGVGPTS